MPLLWLPTAAALMWRGVAVGGLPLAMLPLAAVVGVLVWQVLEYSIHRCGWLAAHGAAECDDLCTHACMPDWCWQGGASMRRDCLVTLSLRPALYCPVFCCTARFLFHFDPKTPKGIELHFMVHG